jgi:Sortase domain
MSPACATLRLGREQDVPRKRSAGRRVRAALAAASALGTVVVLLAGCAGMPPALAGQASPTPGRVMRYVRPGRPVHIQIPAIGLDWPVVPVGRDATGAMDAPQGLENAPSWHEGFWWEYGFLAGQPGNAVIAGHVDDVVGNLTPFAGISRLQPGDAIYVGTDRGDTLRFAVTHVGTVENPVGGPNDPTIASIFGPSESPNLNLLTCTGNWVGNEFDQRLVVYSTLAQDSSG